LDKENRGQTAFELIIVSSFVMVIVWTILLNIPHVGNSTGAMVAVKESVLGILAEQDKFYFIEEVTPPELDESVAPAVWRMKVVIGGEDITADAALKNRIETEGESAVKEKGYYADLNVEAVKSLA